MIDQWKEQAEAYAYKYGFENAVIAVGQRDGKAVIFSDTAGAYRWDTKFQPEKDGGVFHSEEVADAALTRAKSIYGDIDKAVTDVTVLQVQSLDVGM